MSSHFGDCSCFFCENGVYFEHLLAKKQGFLLKLCMEKGVYTKKYRFFRCKITLFHKNILFLHGEKIIFNQSK